MTVHAPARPSVGVRRLGYAIAAGINAAMLFAVNRWPGWDVLPFLTGDFRQVLGWINASLAAGMLANLIYLAWDTPWFKALGDLFTTCVGLAALVQVWRVFPFDFPSDQPWSLLTRVVLLVAAGGCLIGILVQAMTFARAVFNPRSHS